MTGMHTLMFGSSLEDSVQYIVGNALRKNSIEAYTEAANKLQGIRTFFIFLQPEGQQVYTYALLALGNEISRLFQLIDDPAARELVKGIVP